MLASKHHATRLKPRNSYFEDDYLEARTASVLLRK